MEDIKKVLFDVLKGDEDFIDAYASYKKNLEGYEVFLKRTIECFVSDFNIYLDKPYIDISYLKLKNDSLIDVDLLWEIFKSDLKELKEEQNPPTNSAYASYINYIEIFDEIGRVLKNHDKFVGSSEEEDLHGWFYTLVDEIKHVKEKNYVNF